MVLYMGVNGQTLYIKAEQNVEVNMRDVTLGDLISMECQEKNVVSKLKTCKILKIPEQGPKRCVVSVLKIIACIHEQYPSLEIENLGESDIIVTYEGNKSRSAFMEKIEIVGVTLLSFVGAAFAIMTFNNDSGTTTLFKQIYQMIMGQPSDGYTVLEASYCVGLVVGILLFFNHFGKKRFSVDPTPIEVEMRLYEKDIQTTIIEDYSRKGKELDVGKSNATNNDRT